MKILRLNYALNIVILATKEQFTGNYECKKTDSKHVEIVVSEVSPFDPIPASPPLPLPPHPGKHPNATMIWSVTCVFFRASNWTRILVSRWNPQNQLLRIFKMDSRESAVVDLQILHNQSINVPERGFR